MDKFDLTEQYVKCWVKVQKEQRKLESLREKLLPKVSTFVVCNGFTVSRITRPVFRNVTLEDAKKYGAIKKAVDTTKLTDLINEGVKVKGVTFTDYLSVKTPPFM